MHENELEVVSVTDLEDGGMRVLFNLGPNAVKIFLAEGLRSVLLRALSLDIDPNEEEQKTTTGC